MGHSFSPAPFCLFWGFPHSDVTRTRQGPGLPGQRHHLRVCQRASRHFRSGDSLLPWPWSSLRLDQWLLVQLMGDIATFCLRLASLTMVVVRLTHFSCMRGCITSGWRPAGDNYQSACLCMLVRRHLWCVRRGWCSRAAFGHVCSPVKSLHYLFIWSLFIFYMLVYSSIWSVGLELYGIFALFEVEGLPCWHRPGVPLQSFGAHL